MPILTTQISTPVGTLIAGATDGGICLFDYGHRRGIAAIKARIATGLGLDFVEGEHPLFGPLREQVSEYFAGTRTAFTLPLQMQGSSFQKRVWEALLAIPYGETRSYKAQSSQLSAAGAIRAVARANGENALAMLVPCHRVVGEDGSLTGYSGGLQAKQWLLRHEQRHAGKSAGQLQLFAASDPILLPA